MHTLNAFNVIAEPPDSTDLTLSLASLYAAQTYEDLQGDIVLSGGTATITDYAFGLRPLDPAGELWEWNGIPGAMSYDLIRGDLSSLLDDGGAVRLGDVICVADDSVDTTTGPGTERSNPDLATPLSRQTFIYLVRFRDAMSARTYGFSFDGGKERIVDSGDCP